MNDFTKEELEALLSAIKVVWVADGTEIEDKLFEKLQSMIDNYCEHDLYETSSLVSHCCKCGKCEMVSL